MTDLHALILARFEDSTDLVLSPGPYANALAAVVEMHRPDPDLPSCAECCCARWPCVTILGIARDLGVDARP